MNGRRLSKLAVSALLAAAFAPAASALALDGTLPAAYYTTYGDSQVYSLGTLAYIYCREQTGGTCGNATGTPYNVDSSAGTIQDLVVVATGVNGGPINTNFAGMDNPYPTPSGRSGSPYFSTTSIADPGEVAGGVFQDRAGSWDTSVAALLGQLGSSTTPVFMFNNNQLDSAVNLAAWGRVWVSSSADSAETPFVAGGKALNFYLTNQRIPGVSSAYLDPLLQHSGGGIDFNEPGGTSPWNSFTGSGTAPVVGANNDPLDTGDQRVSDYLLSGSDYCVNSTTFLPQECGTVGASPRIKNNLGANEVAYAVLFPELNEWLAGLTVAERQQFTLHVDFRLGCQKADGTDVAATDQTHCLTQGTDNRSLNNGYEQLFIASLPEGAVPAPGTLALIGLVLSGLGMVRRRQRA